MKQNAEAIEITKQSDTDYRLGLGQLTRQDGYFVLTVQTADITDTEGFKGSEGRTASWIQFPGIVEEGQDYDLVITSAGYATFYDSQWNYQLPDALKAYVVKGEKDHQLSYRSLNGSVVPRGVPVLIESSPLQAGVHTLTCTQEDAEYTGMNLLRGTDEPVVVKPGANEYAYKLAYGPTGTEWSEVLGWFWGAEDGGSFMIEGHKAWLVVPSNSDGVTRGFYVNGEPIVDLSSQPQQPVHVYDLQGRRVKKPAQKGIYIKEGKKITIKR